MNETEYHVKQTAFFMDHFKSLSPVKGTLWYIYAGLHETAAWTIVNEKQLQAINDLNPGAYKKHI